MVLGWFLDPASLPTHAERAPFLSPLLVFQFTLCVTDRVRQRRTNRLIVMFVTKFWLKCLHFLVVVEGNLSAQHRSKMPLNTLIKVTF
jgi:hypothetical protein